MDDINAFDIEPFHLPFPSDFADEPDEDVLARANSMCGAAEAIMAATIASNQQVPITTDDRLLSTIASESEVTIAGVTSTAVALHLTALLNEYDMTVVQNAQQLRNFCTNILIDKAATGKSEATQLRAVEMLGKIKDVALFEERSTVLVEHMSSDEIKKRLREKVGRLRGIVTASQLQPITDVTPIDNQT